MKLKISTLILGFFMAISTFGQSANHVTDYLGLPNPILFDSTSYHLVQSYHPQDNYYKQEYLAQGDTLERFKKLITIDVLVGKYKLKELVAKKTAELDQIKLSNPVVTYQVFSNDGEMALDFILSVNSADGKSISILERNVYRYISTVDKNGKNIILLFGFSDRAYGSGVRVFLENYKFTKQKYLNLMLSFKLPELDIVK